MVTDLAPGEERPRPSGPPILRLRSAACLSKDQLSAPASADSGDIR